MSTQNIKFVYKPTLIVRAMPNHNSALVGQLLQGREVSITGATPIKDRRGTVWVQIDNPMVGWVASHNVRDGMTNLTNYQAEPEYASSPLLNLTAGKWSVVNGEFMNPKNEVIPSMTAIRIKDFISLMFEDDGTAEQRLEAIKDAGFRAVSFEVNYSFESANHIGDWSDFNAALNLLQAFGLYAIPTVPHSVPLGLVLQVIDEHVSYFKSMIRQSRKYADIIPLWQTQVHYNRVPDNDMGIPEYKQVIDDTSALAHVIHEAGFLALPGWSTVNAFNPDKRRVETVARQLYRSGFDAVHVGYQPSDPYLDRINAQDEVAVFSNPKKPSAVSLQYNAAKFDEEAFRNDLTYWGLRNTNIVILDGFTFSPESDPELYAKMRDIWVTGAFAFTQL